MPANTSHIWPLTPICAPVRISNATGTGKVTLYSPGTSGGILAGIECTSTDTAARLVQIFLTVGGTDYLVATVNVPALSGNDGTTVALNLLTQPNVPAIGDDWSWTLPSTAVVKLATTTTVTSGKQLDFSPRAIDY
jgi:hypothetical protein